MDTIYDHNVSEKELHILDKMTPGRIIDHNRQNYMKYCSSDLLFADLFRLYDLRGDNHKSQFYFDQIQDVTLKYLLKNF